MRDKIIMKYSKLIGKVEIIVLVDKEIVNNKGDIIHSILRDFSFVDEESTKEEEQSLFYVSEEEYLVNINDNWAFLLMKNLEAYYADILDCTVIHGSCVSVNDKNILLIGERRTGKTTLVQYLTLEKNAKVINDDCVYLFDNAYIGFGMPLPMRGEPNPRYYKHYLTKCLDTDNFQRTLYLLPHYIESVSKIDIVAFPKYGVDKMNKLTKINQRIAFNNIMNNIRSHNNMKTLFMDIKKTVDNSICYIMEYTNSDIAHNMLLSIL